MAPTHPSKLQADGQRNFTLSSLTLDRHPFFGNLTFDLSQAMHQDRQWPMTSVLIGPNGIGKSRLLRALADVFSDVNSRRSGKQFKAKLDFNYTVKYTVGNSTYCVTNIDSANAALKDNRRIALRDLEIPASILVLSFHANDQFRFTKDAGYYNYFGLRSASNTAGTRSGMKRLAALIARESIHRLHPLRILAKTLKIHSSLRIVFKVRQVGELMRLRTRQDIDARLLQWEQDKALRPYRASRYEAMSPEARNRLLKFLLDSRVHLEQTMFAYEMEFGKKDHELRDAFPFLEQLMALGFVLAPSIEVARKEDRFPIQDASSGEFHLLLTFLKVALVGEPSSLILIDEPETSLHPNWQVRFLELVKKAFANLASSHFIFATHSHLLVADAQPESSAVLALSRKGHKIDAEILAHSPFGWSAENILYRVFGVATFRNTYFDKDVRRTIGMLESGRIDVDKLSALLMTFERFELTEDDPLNSLVKEARAAIRNA